MGSPSGRCLQDGGPKADLGLPCLRDPRAVAERARAHHSLSGLFFQRALISPSLHQDMVGEVGLQSRWKLIPYLTVKTEPAINVPEKLSQQSQAFLHGPEEQAQSFAGFHKEALSG